MFFICRTTEFTDDINDDDEQEKFDFAILNKEEFDCLSDDEKIDFCYGITKGFENKYTNKSQDNDPYLLDWIIDLLRDRGLYKEFFYEYLSSNFKEKFKALLSEFPEESDEKFDAAYEIWDEGTDEFGLHHFYLFGINEIYINKKYYKILYETSSFINEQYDGMFLAREKFKIKNKKRKEGIYNHLIKQNRSNWDKFIKDNNISYPPSIRFRKIYPQDLNDDEKEAFAQYVELIYWNKELKSENMRRKTFKDYPDVNF